MATERIGMLKLPDVHWVDMRVKAADSVWDEMLEFLNSPDLLGHYAWDFDHNWSRLHDDEDRAMFAFDDPNTAFMFKMRFR